ncbi:MAG: uroporphyrinogen decarboxylase family protein [bacterium]
MEPDWIRDYCETYTEFFIRHFTYLFDQVGLPDGMFIYEDLGYSNGPFCSPKTYRELIFPHHKRIFDFFHNRGLPVLLHSCGDVRQMVPAVIEAGIDCLQPMEAKAGVDVFSLAKEYEGQLAFMGNIDVTVLNKNDPEQVRQYVHEKVTTLRDRGVPYIFHSDHSIPPDVHLDTYKLALEILRSEGAYRT